MQQFLVRVGVNCCKNATHYI